MKTTSLVWQRWSDMNMNNLSYEQIEKVLAPNYRVGLYLRLSKDDDIHERESSSISHQREMLTKFCEQKGWFVEKEYIDDGFSGLSMKRPSMQRMLKDVSDGKINLVLTKDYSRLGRNRLETEKLREEFFPRNGCRYIAVNDNIDTMYDDDYAPFKAIINEQYSKDIAKKVHSSYVNQAQKGRFTGCVAPFGYLKDPEQSLHLIIDEETAPYVRKIFEMARDGHGVGYIKRRLEAEKVPCPTWWNRQRGIRNHYTKYELADEENGRYVWDDTVLTDMLINPVYYGAVSAQKKNYRFKLGVLGEKKPDEWIVVEGMHEPIVDKDTFDVVQEKIRSRKCSRNNGKTSLFAGLIKCGECGKALTIRRTHAKNPIDIYSCKTYNHLGKHHCTQHRIEYDTLYDLVLKEVRDVAKRTLNAEQVADDMAKQIEADRNAEREAMQRQLTKAKDRLQTLERLIARLYDDLLAGRISESNFDSMMKKTTEEQTKLTEQVGNFETKLSDNDAYNNSYNKWVELAGNYIAIKELDSESLNQLIKKIIVHENISEDGTRNISVEIHYNFKPVNEPQKHYLNSDSSQGSSPVAV